MTARIKPFHAALVAKMDDAWLNATLDGAEKTATIPGSPTDSDRNSIIHAIRTELYNRASR